jgi:hypothetical protein
MEVNCTEPFPFSWCSLVKVYLTLWPKFKAEEHLGVLCHGHTLIIWDKTWGQSYKTFYDHNLRILESVGY